VDAPARAADEGRTAGLGPTKARERIITLDILRGIALLGVLIANVYLWFNGLFFLPPESVEELGWTWLDSIVFYGIEAFVEGKAITIFSLLFGIGFALQMMRAEEKGVRFTSFFRRRLLVLFLFGAVHAFFLWYGDILMAYSLLGCALLLFRRRSDRTLLVWAGALAVGVPFLLATIPWLQATLLGHAEPAALIGWGNYDPASLEAFRSGVPALIFSANLAILIEDWTGKWAMFVLPAYLGIFLIGLYIGRRRIFENIEAHHAAFRLVRTWGLALGAPLAIAGVVLGVVVPPEAWDTTLWLAIPGTMLFVIPMLLLAGGYVATATLLVHDHTAWRRRLSLFAPVGRMALTNYLAQTVLCLPIFYGYGLGLMGRVGPAISLLICFLVFGAQIIWSHWWLARFRYGPLEWLWRVATYGKLQPMRVPATVQPTAAST